MSITTDPDAKADPMTEDRPPPTRGRARRSSGPRRRRSPRPRSPAWCPRSARWTPTDWTRPTDCPLWDVRAMAGHVLGMTETFSGLGKFASNMRAGGKRAGDGPFIDGLTAVQVDATAGLSTGELIDRLEAVGPVAARWRAQPAADAPHPDQGRDRRREGDAGRWPYLVDIILTRDTWMHRADIAKATGKPMELTREHDGRIVADAAAEWGRLHGQPCTLHLTGPVGRHLHPGRRRRGDHDRRGRLLPHPVSGRAPARASLRSQRGRRLLDAERRPA